MEIETKTEKKKRQVNPDRIVLEAASVELVKRIQAQVEEAFAGVVALTSKEVANFVLQRRCDLLSGSELEAIRAEHFDDVRAAQWALKRLKSAKSGGEHLSLKEVLKMIETPHVNKSRSTGTQKAKRKVKDHGPTREAVSLDNAPSIDVLKEV